MGSCRILSQYGRNHWDFPLPVDGWSENSVRSLMYVPLSPCWTRPSYDVNCTQNGPPRARRRVRTGARPRLGTRHSSTEGFQTILARCRTAVPPEILGLPAPVHWADMWQIMPENAACRACDVNCAPATSSCVARIDGGACCCSSVKQSI